MARLRGAGSMAAQDRRRDTFHGRRHGRRLRKGQKALLSEMLPRLRVELPAAGGRLDPATLFGAPGAGAAARREVWVEIGFGGGEHLAWQAAHHPEVGFLGAEYFVNGIASLLRNLQDAGLQNVRIYQGDGRAVLAALPPASLSRAFILFPDPWPKVRHHKRRIVQRDTLDALARVLRDGVELRLATDDMEYARWMLALLLKHADFEWLAERAEDWRRRPADWPETRYEAKAVSQGRRPLYLRFRRRARRAWARAPGCGSAGESPCGLRGSGARLQPTVWFGAGETKRPVPGRREVGRWPTFLLVDHALEIVALVEAGAKTGTVLAKTSEGKAAEIERMIAPTVADMGYDIVRVLLSGNRRVRLQIMAERRDGAPMNVDNCAELSHAVSAVLDVEDPIAGAYELEVSSPGIDRPLTRLADFDRFAGFEAKLETVLPIDGRRRWRGRLCGTAGGAIVIETEAGEVALPFSDVSKARLVLTDELLAVAGTAPETAEQGTE